MDTLVTVVVRFAFMVCVLSSFVFPGEEDNLRLPTLRCRAAGGAEPPNIPNNVAPDVDVYFFKANVYVEY